MKLTLQESQLESLRTSNQRSPENFEILLQLASLLHQLDHAHPDGGSRIPEAEAAYRYDQVIGKIYLNVFGSQVSSPVEVQINVLDCLEDIHLL